ncbi:MAG: DUF6282 family protein [Actinomycetota bacterium]
MIDIEGAFDFHVHSAPDLFERPYQATDIAEEALRQGMHGLVLKNHFEPSVTRALITQRSFPDLKLVGGVVLNRPVGGLNPYAVEASVKQGGRIIWFPTTDSANHFSYFGRTSSYDEGNAGDGGPRLSGGSDDVDRLTSGPGITVLSDGELKPEVKDIIGVAREHDQVISSAHLAPEEAKAVHRFARDLGHRRLLLGHALWKPLGLEMDDLKELIEFGVTIEFGASITLPIPGHAPPRLVVETMYELGVANCIISSDAGAAVYPKAPEALRSYVQCLVDTGLDPADAKLMMHDNPLRLLEG